MSDRKIRKKISPFVQKLLDILQNPINNNCISWASTDTFVIVDSDQLSKNVLSKYFKHNNFSSFIRQLNIYGFQKVKSQLNYHYYHHRNFIKNEKKQLKLIQRKIKKNDVADKSSDFQESFKQVYQHKSELKHMILQLQNQNKRIRNQNTILNKQITIIKQDNKKQMEKILNFLSNLVKGSEESKSNKQHLQIFPQKLRQYLAQTVKNQIQLLQNPQRQQMQKNLQQICSLLIKIEPSIQANSQLENLIQPTQQMKQLITNPPIISRDEQNRSIFNQNNQFQYQSQNYYLPLEKFF